LRRLLMLTAGQPASDPRARRAAAAAKDAGYEVVSIGASRGPTGPARVRSRAIRGLGRVWRLAAATLALTRAGRRAGPFDVVHAHDFATLPAGRLLARGSTRLVYDAHEVYADQEPDAPRLQRTLVRLLEGPLARLADAVITVSEPIAKELGDTLGLERKPIVVLSCPPRSELVVAERGDGPLLALYQGAMGPGRPLEDLLVAAEHAEGVRLTVRVIGADPTALDDPRVEVAEPVAPERLVEAAAKFHVGLVINRPVTRNDELVLPNKLFEYLMAGLAVVVPRLPGLAPLVEGEAIGLTYEPGRPDLLGAALMKLARDPKRLDEMRQRARRLAIERFNAESQVPALLEAWGA
jgi:glycosyltransferase involved in cell wall biosynthesis